MVATLFLNLVSKYLESYADLDWWDRSNFASFFLVPWDEQKDHELLHEYEMNRYITILLSVASVRKHEGPGWFPHVHIPFKCYKNNASFQRKAYFSFCRCNYDTPVSAILRTMDICGESCWKNLSAPLPSSASQHHWSEHFCNNDIRASSPARFLFSL